MTNKFKNIVDNLISWGMSSDKLFAALVIGSQARDNHTADEYSDMDVVLIVDNPSYFIESDQWLNAIPIFANICRYDLIFLNKNYFRILR